MHFMDDKMDDKYILMGLDDERSKHVAEVLRSKRAEKANNRAIQKQSVNNLQQQIDTGQFGSASVADRGRNDRPGGANQSAPSRGGFDSAERGSALHG